MVPIKIYSTRSNCQLERRSAPFERGQVKGTCCYHCQSTPYWKSQSARQKNKGLRIGKETELSLYPHRWNVISNVCRKYFLNVCKLFYLIRAINVAGYKVNMKKTVFLYTGSEQKPRKDIIYKSNKYMTKNVVKF